MDSVDLVAFDFLVGAIADVGVVGGARFAAHNDGRRNLWGGAVQFIKTRLELRSNSFVGPGMICMGVSHGIDAHAAMSYNVIAVSYKLTMGVTHLCKTHPSCRNFIPR